MTSWQLRSGRRKTGAVLNRNGKKTKYQRGRDFVPSQIGAEKRRVLRTKGGGTKVMSLASSIANISIKGKVQKAKIITVKENSADSQFVRRNIITKGAIIETDLGKARVTSRPGQEGVVNAVLIEKK